MQFRLLAVIILPLTLQLSSEAKAEASISILSNGNETVSMETVPQHSSTAIVTRQLICAMISLCEQEAHVNTNN